MRLHCSWLAITIAFANVSAAAGSANAAAPAPATGEVEAPNVASTREQSMVERNLWSSSFHSASQSTQQAAGASENKGQDLQSLAETQSMLGDVSVASDAVFAGGASAYLYSEFFQKPEGQDPQSDAKTLEKAAKMNEIAGYAMMGSGAVDVGIGGYAHLAITGQLRDADAGEAAIQANKDAANSHLMWGVGKAGAGYMLKMNAEKLRQQSEDMASVKVSSSADAGTRPLSAAAQATYNGPIHANGNAPLIGSVAPASQGSKFSGASQAQEEIFGSPDLSGASAVTSASDEAASGERPNSPAGSVGKQKDLGAVIGNIELGEGYGAAKSPIRVSGEGNRAPASEEGARGGSRSGASLFGSLTSEPAMAREIDSSWQKLDSSDVRESGSVDLFRVIRERLNNARLKGRL